MHEYGSFMSFGWFIPLLMIVVIFYFIREEKSPLDILNERLAKGEIDETEYLQKKKLL